MTVEQSASSTPKKPLRLWPGVLIVVLQWLALFGLPTVVPEAMPVGVFSGLIAGALVLLWWLFLSRAAWPERIGAVVLMLGALAATPLILHESVATAAMGMLFYIYGVPTLSLAFVAWAVATHRLGTVPRRLTMVVTILLACGAWGLFRNYGVTGGFDWDFAWRWEQTPEEQLLAQAANEPGLPVPTSEARKGSEEPLPEANAEAAAFPGTATSAETSRESRSVDFAEEGLPPAAVAPVSKGRGATDRTPVRASGWPGFRGPERDGVVRGVVIATDWSASPPTELWRRAVGPGWSSFAAVGDLLYTQEQRGEDEAVSCYRTTTGEPVWRHLDPVRFWEAMAGAGPRSTPTVHSDRVYSFGATGIVNALDALTGSVVWSRNAAQDTHVEIPGWGFASSPLVTDDLVIIAVAGQLIAYDRTSGQERWQGPKGGESYSSPQLLEIDGVTQVLLMNGTSTVGLSLADGSLLWEHSWPGFHSLQPTLTANGDVLLGNSGSSTGLGTRRIAVHHDAEGWATEEVWTSLGLKPYFNDFVIHEGYAYGFDGRILAAIDLANGERVWKGGRYGNGQLVLLADQDLLLVISEKGELALVSATPDQFTELGRLPAIEGKTWNHPVVAGDLLFVRNDHEMVAFRLPAAGST